MFVECSYFLVFKFFLLCCTKLILCYSSVLQLKRNSFVLQFFKILFWNLLSTQNILYIESLQFNVANQWGNLADWMDEWKVDQSFWHPKNKSIQLQTPQVLSQPHWPQPPPITKGMYHWARILWTGYCSIFHNTAMNHFAEVKESWIYCSCFIGDHNNITTVHSIIRLC